MDIPRLNKSVRKVTVLHQDQAGNLVPVVIYQKGGKKKKRGSAVLRPLDKFIRRTAAAQQVYASNYLDRHNNSNQKRKDGWIHDLPVNVLKARNKANTKLADA